MTEKAAETKKAPRKGRAVKMEAEGAVVGAKTAQDKVDPVREALVNAGASDFSAVVVIGVNDLGAVDIISSLPQYAFLNHILNKATLNLLLHEQENINKASQAMQVAE